MNSLLARLHLTRTRPPHEPDWSHAVALGGAIIAAGVMVLLIASTVQGCAGATPLVRVHAVEGAGSIDLETCLQHEDGSLTGCVMSSLAFASEGVTVDGADGAPELVHCATIRRLVLAGLPFGVGLLPAPLSDARCEGAAFDPFPGARPAIEPAQPGQ